MDMFFHEQGNLEHVFIVSKVQGSENVRFNKQGSTCEHRLWTKLDEHSLVQWLMNVLQTHFH